MKKLTLNQKYYLVLVLGGLVGFIASFWQLLDKLTLLKNSQAALSCNLNSVFNCSDILNAQQSSVFGFPNSLLCVILFLIAIVLGVAGLTGSILHKWVRFVAQGMALFTVGFGMWYLWQSIFNVGAFCIFCIFCFAGVLIINAAWFRLNYKDLSLSDKWTAKGIDYFVWCLIALVIIFEAIIKFA
jgi:uncharacterized membrane protein